MSDERDEPWLPESADVIDEHADLEEAEDDEDDDEEEDDELLESYGADLDAPWSPVPVEPWRAFLRANPSAKLDLIFPEAYAEDRSAKLKDLATAQGLDYISHQRAATQAAQEFGFEQFDYNGEMQAIRDEKKKYGDLLGAGDALAGRIAGGGDGGGGLTIGAPSAGLAAEDEDERERRRSDLAGPARRRFRKTQREVVITFVERDPATGLIQRLVDVPGLVAPEPTPATPPSDLEAAIREKRRKLQAKRSAEAAAEGLGHVGGLKHTPELLAEARAQTRAAERKLLTKSEVSYRYVAPTEQVAKFGAVIEACAICTHFLKPNRCEIVEPPIRPEDVCNRFNPKRRPA